MKSQLVEALNPEFEPVVLVRSEHKPDNALQPAPGKYVCIMSYFAQAAVNGRTVAFDRETSGCPGARAGLGLGDGYAEAMGGYDTFAAFFARGLDDAADKEAYAEIAGKANAHVRRKLLAGERFHCSPEKAYRWITRDLPIYDFPERYAVIKPLKDLADDETAQSVIFTVNPLQLTALMTLAGAIREGINDTVTPQGAACQMIGAYVFREAESADPRAVLGMIDLAARKNVRSLLPDNILTYAVPWKLFADLEAEASDGIFASPLWLDLAGR